VKHYDVLFIDLDDTLYDFSSNSRDAYEEVYALLDYDRYFDGFQHYYTIYTDYNAQLWVRYAAGEITRDYLNAERYTHPLRVVGAPDPDTLGTRFWHESMQRLPLGKRLMPHAREVLDYLRPRYRKIYILSNGFTELQARKMQSAGITHYFDGMVLSEDIGVNKPHPDIFLHALRVASTTADNALMVGDNFEVDILGARGVGIDQVYYNPMNKPVPSEAQPTHVINSLVELKEIL
jgi:putative hydrolase of the HAD superfamily